MQLDEQTWIETQVRRFGPLIGGEELRQFLGFRTPEAFQKARTLGSIELPIFPLPGRRGHFAFTDEACAWLLRQRAARSTVGPDSREGDE